MNKNLITKAVFPVAGFGTRFMPATKATPKEMLTVVDKPLIQYAVEEAYDAGIRQMIFVTGRNKYAIENHFDLAYELETELELANKFDILDVVRNVCPKDMQCVFIRQNKMLGLGHAILCTEKLIKNESFAIILADDLMVGAPPVMKQLVDIYNNSDKSNIIAVEQVSLNQTELYGVVETNNRIERTAQVTKLFEKPKHGQTDSNLAITGRYILHSDIFQMIKSIGTVPGNEIQLTNAIQKLTEYQDVYAYEFQGNRFDCGSKLGFLKANVTFGLSNMECRDEFRSWLLGCQL
jgi:UTP--glucose-1-phosphate uridylyltransferase